MRCGYFSARRAISFSKQRKDFTTKLHASATVDCIKANTRSPKVQGATYKSFWHSFSGAGTSTAVEAHVT